MQSGLPSCVGILESKLIDVNLKIKATVYALYLHIPDPSCEPLRAAGVHRINLRINLSGHLDCYCLLEGRV